MHTHVRDTCEPRPGVYRFLGRNGTVVYVGTSRRLRTRLLGYFSKAKRRAKAPRILRHAVQVEWDYLPDAFGALLAELRAIKRYRPLFNTTHVSDEWPRGYAALTHGPVPGLRIVRATDDPSAARLWGPFRNVRALTDAVRALADVTGVRDCSLESTPMQWRTSVRDGATSRRAPFSYADTRGSTTTTRVAACLRHALGSCPGMCIGEGDAAAYARAVERATAILDRRPSSLLRDLEQAMHDAGAELAFERAAALRDKRARLLWLRSRLARFHADADRLTFVYAPPSDTPHLYLIRRGTVRADRPVPRSEQEERELDQLISRVYLAPETTGRDIPTHDLEEFALIASWFRRHPDARTHTRTPAVRAT
jgi:excinuclease ABC subunit C